MNKLPEFEMLFIWTVPFQVLGFLSFLFAKRKYLAFGICVNLIAPQIFYLVAAVIGSWRILDGYEGGGFIHLMLLIPIGIGLMANSIFAIVTTGMILAYYKLLAQHRKSSFWDFFDKTKRGAENKI
jgi:hypothetical protein